MVLATLNALADFIFGIATDMGHRGALLVTALVLAGCLGGGQLTLYAILDPTNVATTLKGVAGLMLLLTTVYVAVRLLSRLFTSLREGRQRGTGKHSS
ncbi:MAG: hypothetical protein JWN95_3675 [Frankiales bacterium]|nr:hypothetical protein [Frankiales bacterium]